MIHFQVFGFTMEWNRLIAVKTVCSFAVDFSFYKKKRVRGEAE
jgi:hypothetical protein